MQSFVMLKIQFKPLNESEILHFIIGIIQCGCCDIITHAAFRYTNMAIFTYFDIFIIMNSQAQP